MENENMFLDQMNQNNNVNDLNWECIADHGGAGASGVDYFESALSSMVSSPTASNGNPNINGETAVLRELIGRLGGICSNEISPPPYNANSCYSTPLSSPPKLNLSTAAMEDGHRLRRDHQIVVGNSAVSLQNINSLQSFAQQFPTDPGFAERAARFSCFASNNLSGGGGGGFVPPPSAASSSSSSRVLPSSTIHRQQSLMNNNNKEEEQQLASASDKKLKTSESANAEFADSRENSTVSNCQTDARKRRQSAKTAKDVNVQSETSAKRIKSEENGNNEKVSKDNSKASEPPKDYIHVRARRGQATDAHSLAERVRREKISERMKLLQDLVPGCNKVTGKAVMLDEIINYVQSLQRQVEFLSMKLATINPRMDFNVEPIASSKDMFQQSLGSFLHSNYGSDHCYPYISYNETVSQVSTTYMEDDLHSVVQMGFQKNMISQRFEDGNVMAAARMKVED